MLLLSFRPLTLSENLTKQALKIDWTKGEDDDNEDILPPVSAIDKEAEEEDNKKTDFQHPTWPWDSVRNKLRLALTEACVLSDVLSIAKEKRFMVLDPVQQDQPEQRQLAQLFSKKRVYYILYSNFSSVDKVLPDSAILQGLTAAANILLHGAERLKMSQADTNRARSNQDFHLELLRLRQSWRLKKVGNTILGDLSYRSAGSRFHQTGVFEVSKAEDTGTEQTESQTKPTTIKVTIPSELDGTAYIQVTIQKGVFSI